MARENYTMLYGQVYKKPSIYIDKEGNMLRGVCFLKVLRRIYHIENISTGQLRLDMPILVTENPELIKKMAALNVGDMIDVKSALSTKNVKKTSYCSEKHENVFAGNMVYVTPIYINVRKEKLNEDEGLIELKENSEISNTAVLIGTVCKIPEYYQDEQGRMYCQYQLAVKRKIRIKEDEEDKTTDFPFIKTFGPQAEEDSKRLKVGSVVYINGALQTRTATRKSVCEVCGEEYTWEEGVMEVVPYSVEYLRHCYDTTGETEIGDDDEIYGEEAGLMYDESENKVLTETYEEV